MQENMSFANNRAESNNGQNSGIDDFASTNSSNKTAVKKKIKRKDLKRQIVCFRCEINQDNQNDSVRNRSVADKFEIGKIQRLDAQPEE